MDRNMYTNKCFDLLDNEQFKYLDNDPTSKTEGKVQRLLRSIKSKLPEKVYKTVYPTGSRPGKFYGTAKLHKLTEQRNTVTDLPVRPIVSNIGTSTYQLSKYLSKLLYPLSKSEYTVNSTKHFINLIRK